MTSKIVFVLLLLILGVSCIHIRGTENHMTEQDDQEDQHDYSGKSSWP